MGVSRAVGEPFGAPRGRAEVALDGAGIHVGRGGGMLRPRRAMDVASPMPQIAG